LEIDDETIGNNFRPRETIGFPSGWAFMVMSIG